MRGGASSEEGRSSHFEKGSRNNQGLAFCREQKEGLSHRRDPKTEALSVD